MIKVNTTTMDEYTKDDIIEVDDNPLIICKACGKLVVKTMGCMYCGAPILFKMPRTDDEVKGDAE